MGLYNRYILPRLMEIVLTRPEFLEQRREALRTAAGRVLEIGFGFGASLEAYPPDHGQVLELTALEPNPGMTRRALSRMGSARFPIRLLRGRAEVLPVADSCFDTVVTNWTLCSLSDPHRGLAEIRRSLRPSGRFLFLEHGRAEDPRLVRRQAWLTPLQRILADGCRLDLQIDETIRAAGFMVETLRRYEAPWGPRTLRQMYCGVARRGN
jgi:ubiquinone/menaquinone biosynthesis C-methylase UbiE